jgi:hypothetical protein
MLTHAATRDTTSDRARTSADARSGICVMTMIAAPVKEPPCESRCC